MTTPSPTPTPTPTPTVTSTPTPSPPPPSPTPTPTESLIPLPTGTPTTGAVVSPDHGGAELAATGGGAEWLLGIVLVFAGAIAIVAARTGHVR